MDAITLLEEYKAKHPDKWVNQFDRRTLNWWGEDIYEYSVKGTEIHNGIECYVMDCPQDHRKDIYAPIGRTVWFDKRDLELIDSELYFAS